jgi:Cdc6-like AAA superfamily ATPase
MSFLEGALRTVLGGGRSGSSVGPLVEPVERFVAEVAEVLVGLAGTVAGPLSATPAELERDVAIEAMNIAMAIADADGRHGDTELAALAQAFGGRFGPAATVGLSGRSTWIERPSTLFEILVGHDSRDGTRTAWRYYELAMRIAHTVAGLDAVTSEAELVAIDRLRSTLLDTMRAGPPSPSARQAAGGGPPGTAPAAAAPAAEAELPPARPLAELLAELDALTGLAPVKAEIHRVADLLRVMQLRRERGLPTTGGSRHLVFTGNPGTGKTTVARLVAQIYRTLGVVERGHLVETDRSGLVAGFVGQTATKVRAVVESALEGVLLVDEAYALVRGSEGDFGREAIDTLVKMVEDHRDDLVVILAGYPDEMAQLVAANPGLKSRFPTTIHFPDYTTDELVEIFAGMCRAASYEPTDAALDVVRRRFADDPREQGFGNARTARNMFEAAVARHASRIVDLTETGATPTDEQLSTLEPADLEGVDRPLGAGPDRPLGTEGPGPS